MGRRIAFTQGERSIDAVVVGVASNIANTDPTQAPPPRIFAPLDPAARRFAFVVSSPDPAALTSNVRTVVAENAAAVPIEYLGPMDEALDRAASSDYVIIGVLTGFALVALALASAGLFGVVSYTVSQRTAEFGTRMALGARSTDVMGLVVRDSVKLILIGASRIDPLVALRAD
jgi:putative ABC transport system permease protein